MSHAHRNSKRKYVAQEDEVPYQANAIAGKRERLSSDDGTISRTGRVRKKSSKILEMEEGRDDLEEALTGRKKRKSDPDKQVKPVNFLLQSGKKRKSVEATSAGDDAVLNSPEQDAEESEVASPRSSKRSRARKGENVTSPVATPSLSNIIKTEPDGSLKMTLQLGRSPPEAAGTRSSKKSRVKVEPLSPLALEVPEHPDVTSVLEGNSGLKMKLILSPAKDKPAATLSSPEAETAEDKKKKKKLSKAEGKKKKGKEKDGTGIEKIKIKDILAAQQLARDAKALEEQQERELVQKSALAMHLSLLPRGAPPALESSPLPVPEITSSPTQVESKSKRKKSKKKGKEQTIPEIAEEILSGIGAGDDESNSVDGNLEIDLTPKGKADILKRKKKEPKKYSPAKSPKKKVAKEKVPLEVPVLAIDDNNVTIYGNTDYMAMKLMTSQEKKDSKKQTKAKKKAPGEKRKKRRGPTAYMLWCNSYRSKVVAENPERDFAQISKRLGEIWQGLLEKEKLSWKRKAKKIAAKGSTLITTGKLGKKAGKMAFAASSKITSTGPAVKTGNKSGEAAEKVYEVRNTKAVDVAAHLKLLGESLSIIGNRLTESRGQIAVQGSLSVMLDSLLCALGPLSCLTSYVPETQAIEPITMAQTLDNIAYIMPGL
ncbi:HMG box-containing protein 4-like [Lineus longissimus]|uniref:HMG box-containing protein 4-like n=1 Tax=Lineus longissimus TaxID=88925 RepID=UPI002B4E89AF